MSDTFDKKSISIGLCHRMIAAAEDKARRDWRPDEYRSRGRERRAQGVQPDGRRGSAPVKIAQDKAYTAVGFGMPSHGWYDFIKDDPPLAAGAPSGIDRLLIFGGGYPIQIGDTMVGAIGVSGATLAGHGGRPGRPCRRGRLTPRSAAGDLGPDAVTHQSRDLVRLGVPAQRRLGEDQVAIQ